MNVEVHTLNAFAKGERGGNPAGVVLEGGLSLYAAEMQLIAKELGFSETAFMEKSLLADYKIPACGLQNPLFHPRQRS